MNDLDRAIHSTPSATLLRPSQMDLGLLRPAVKALAKQLHALGVDSLSHSQIIELLARQFGFQSWHEMGQIIKRSSSVDGRLEGMSSLFSEDHRVFEKVDDFCKQLATTIGQPADVVRAAWAKMCQTSQRGAVLTHLPDSDGPWTDFVIRCLHGSSYCNGNAMFDKVYPMVQELLARGNPVAFCVINELNMISDPELSDSRKALLPPNWLDQWDEVGGPGYAFDATYRADELLSSYFEELAEGKTKVQLLRKAEKMARLVVQQHASDPWAGPSDLAKALQLLGDIMSEPTNKNRNLVDAWSFYVQSDEAFCKLELSGRYLDYDDRRVLTRGQLTDLGWLHLMLHSCDPDAVLSMVGASVEALRADQDLQTSEHVGAPELSERWTQMVEMLAHIPPTQRVDLIKSVLLLDQQDAAFQRHRQRMR